MSISNGMTDDEIIRRVKHGDKEIYGRIVERYMRQAYRIALYFTGDNHLAWDVSQEAFFRIFRGIKNFDTSRPFFPYLYRVILNVIKSMKIDMRKENMGELIVPCADDPLDALEKEELLERLSKGLKELSENDREIIYMRHFAGLTYQEIAESLGIPMGTVMSRLYYARRRLAKWMKGYMNS